uniref:Protein kinase domain-containing protein n=1 Tax=Fagus sylvatica TaxID=28930 RepID=A0A2N9HUA9_FAGSY
MEVVSKLFRSGKRAKQSLGLPEYICRRFSLAEIKIATNDFDEHLRLNSKSSVGSDQFSNEVLLLCQLSHPNLVPLIGYCIDEPEMILVHEFMLNGSLYENLHGTDSDSDPLPWKQRLQICIGVARGLHYLHAGVKHCIIHRNVKSSNILLDEKGEAKLTDLGWSKMGPPSLSKALIRMESRAAGTLGYLPPEAMLGELSDKSDIYYFGVVLLEILSGRKALDSNVEEQRRNLVEWALKCVREGPLIRSLIRI